ncbi:MAG: phosphotransferase family protein [Flavobacteriaceae bacterium]
MSIPKDLEKEPRQGEALDLTLLLPWIQQQFPTVTATPVVTQYSGGASNWTYRLQFPNKECILRRAPLGKKAKGAHDMVREYQLQKQLKPSFDRVPTMLALCEDETILGSPFYLMERVEGLILRKNLPKSVRWNFQTAREVCHSFWDVLISLHQIDYKKQGLDTLGKGSGYMERQIHSWSQRYAKSVTWNVPSGKKVMHWLEANLPREERLCLIHNDFRMDNVVLNYEKPSQVIGVLDWEMATIGDPLMDLGNSLAYWIQADDDFFIKGMRRQPSHIEGMLTRDEIIRYYTLKMGLKIEDFRFYRIYGLFRLAGIVQQLYYRYAKGHTQNKAFKNLWMLSFYLIMSCEKIIKKR